MSDRVQAVLGDPYDSSNPLAHEHILAADEQGEVIAAGERALAAHGVNAEFVPERLGGRFRQADSLTTGLRPVFRRDATLGIAYGITSFIGAVPVWTSGDQAQQRWLAELLLAGGRCSAGYTELAHGADFGRTELSARRQGDSFVVRGGKQLINNIERAQAVTVFARTSEQPGSRSHSHLLIDLRAVKTTRLQRSRTGGMRGALLGAIEFDDCAVPASAVVGEPGGAMETVLRAFQATRSILPGVVVGILDSQLRIVTRFATTRRLYDGAVGDMPHVRAALTGAFLDLLIADCLALVGARALHVLPGETSVLTAAVKYLVPKVLQEADYDLSVVLGARSYLRDGEYGIFGKNSRDLPVAALAHASAAVCQASIIPQLPALARRSWLDAAPAPDSLFDLGAQLPALRWHELALNSRGADSVTAMLPALYGQCQGELRSVVADLIAAFAELKTGCAQLAPRDRTVIAGPHSFDLAHRYAVLVAASACLGVWSRRTDFLGDPAWVTAA
ncbi:acyl-CoA dehydrogenase, partial [Amycolatopsis sp. NPDC000740]